MSTTGNPPHGWSPSSTRRLRNFTSCGLDLTWGLFSGLSTPLRFLLEGGEQIRQHDMPPQPDPPIRQGFGGGEFDVEADLQQVTQFLLGLLLADFLVVLVAMEE